jgi:hypothetical protein
MDRELYLRSERFLCCIVEPSLETFVSAWKQLAELREPAKLRPWLATAAWPPRPRARARPNSRPSPKSTTIWVVLAMTMAIGYLGFLCWSYSLVSRAHLLADYWPTTRSLSTRELQNIIADSQVQKLRVGMYQNVRGHRTLSGDLLENGKMTHFFAPAEDSTLARLAEKGISYATEINRDDRPQPRRACFQGILSPKQQT